MLMLIIVKYNVGKIPSSRGNPYVECSTWGRASHGNLRTLNRTVYWPHLFDQTVAYHFLHAQVCHICNTVFIKLLISVM